MGGCVCAFRRNHRSRNSRFLEPRASDNSTFADAECVVWDLPVSWYRTCLLLTSHGLGISCAAIGFPPKRTIRNPCLKIIQYMYTITKAEYLGELVLSYPLLSFLQHYTLIVIRSVDLKLRIFSPLLREVQSQKVFHCCEHWRLKPWCWCSFYSGLKRDSMSQLPILNHFCIRIMKISSRVEAISVYKKECF